MDQQFDRLKSWLLFETVFTILILCLASYYISNLPRNSGNAGDYLAFLIIILTLRLFFVFRAWWSFTGDTLNPPTVESTLGHLKRPTQKRRPFRWPTLKEFWHGKYEDNEEEAEETKDSTTDDPYSEG